MKLNIQKIKIMASGPITSSRQTDGEIMETVTDFIFLSSKINADGDHSHEIKRHLLLGRKAMTNLDRQHIKKQHLLLSHISCVQLCVTPQTAAYQAPVPEILQARTLEWVAIFSPVPESEKWKWSRSVMSDSSPPHGL